MYFILNTKVDKMSTGYHYFSSEKKTFVYEPQTNVFESSAVFPLPGTCFDSQAESIADKTFIRQWSDLRKTK